MTVLLSRMRQGDSEAAETLIPLVLQELRTLARHYMRNERDDHTLQTTALVHEAYMRLVGDQARDWQNRAHFIGVTASLMRRILVDHARKSRASKRQRHMAIAGGDFDSEHSTTAALPVEEMLTLDRALDDLDSVSPRQREIVELRFFGGLSVEETAEVLSVSPITVKRDWSVARAWLRHQLRSERATQPGESV